MLTVVCNYNIIYNKHYTDLFSIECLSNIFAFLASGLPSHPYLKGENVFLNNSTDFLLTP